MIYTFRYAGNKFDFLSEITELLFKVSDRNILIEPFGGSGAVAVNMSKFFNECILNDISSEIMDIHYAFKNASNKDVSAFYNEFPDIQHLQNKLKYYQFREAFNKKYYFTEDRLNRGLGLYYLAGACINSMFRVGPNGFNQGASRQNLSKQLTAIRLQHLHKAYENIELLCEDAIPIIRNYKDYENATFFIDPPYNSTTLDYGTRNDKMELLQLLVHCKGSIIYTDYAIPEQHKLLTNNGFQFKVLRYHAPNIAVGDKAKNTQIRHELIYFKLK